MAGQFTPMFAVDNFRGTHDRDPNSPTQPISITLNVAPGFGWELLNHSGSFWSINGVGAVENGPKTFTVSFDPNPGYFVRTDSAIFLPLGNATPGCLLSLPILQFGHIIKLDQVHVPLPYPAPNIPPLVPPIYNPWWWLPDPVGPPINPAYLGPAPVQQLRLAGVIRYLASHIDDAGIRGRIEAAAMDAERAKIQKLKSAVTPP